MGHRKRNILVIFHLRMSDETAFPYMVSVDTRTGIMNNLPGDLREVRGRRYLVIGHHSSYVIGGSGLVVCDLKERNFYSFGSWFWQDSVLIKRYSKSKHKIRDLRW